MEDDKKTSARDITKLTQELAPGAYEQELQPTPGVYEHMDLHIRDVIQPGATAASLWPARVPPHRAVLVPEPWEGEASSSSPADAPTPSTTIWADDQGKVYEVTDGVRAELKPEGVQMPAGLLAEVICWLRVAADRTNLRHLGTRAITPHDRYAPVKQSELAKVLSKVDAALRQLGVTNVDMIVDRDPTKPVVSATQTREPLYRHINTGKEVRLIHDNVRGALNAFDRADGVVFRSSSDELVWITQSDWQTFFKRVV